MTGDDHQIIRASARNLAHECVCLVIVYRLLQCSHRLRLNPVIGVHPEYPVAGCLCQPVIASRCEIVTPGEFHHGTSQALRNLSSIIRASGVHHDDFICPIQYRLQAITQVIRFVLHDHDHRDRLFSTGNVWQWYVVCICVPLGQGHHIRVAPLHFCWDAPLFLVPSPVGLHRVFPGVAECYPASVVNEHVPCQGQGPTGDSRPEAKVIVFVVAGEEPLVECANPVDQLPLDCQAEATQSVHLDHLPGIGPGPVICELGHLFVGSVRHVTNRLTWQAAIAHRAHHPYALKTEWQQQPFQPAVGDNGVIIEQHDVLPSAHHQPPIDATREASVVINETGENIVMFTNKASYPSRCAVSAGIVHQDNLVWCIGVFPYTGQASPGMLQAVVGDDYDGG